ncbi:MAG: diguanylate cyclase [Burkholderiales bacterium]|nr:diguanylate cyclase [Burkholderiales bacterium]
MNVRAQNAADTEPPAHEETLPERLEMVTRIARRLFRAPVAGISLLSKGALRIVAAEGMPASALGTELAFDREVLRLAGPLVVPDLEVDARFATHPWVVGGPRLRFYAGAILAPDGRPAGVLGVADREANALTEGDLLLLRDLARLAESEVRAALLGRARDSLASQGEQLKRQALFDPRTRLWNRHAMFELIDREFYRSRRERDPVAMIVLEVDRFDAIEAQHGHAEAEAVIGEIARRVRDVVRRSDIVGRAHGAQFLIFLTRCNLENAAKLAERMRHGARKVPIYIGGESLPVTITAGVSATETGGEWMPDQLVRSAEAALATARESGGDAVAVNRL